MISTKVTFREPKTWYFNYTGCPSLGFPNIIRVTCSVFLRVWVQYCGHSDVYSYKNVMFNNLFLASKPKWLTLTANYHPALGKTTCQTVIRPSFLHSYLFSSVPSNRHCSLPFIIFYFLSLSFSCPCFNALNNCFLHFLLFIFIFFICIESSLWLIQVNKFC